MNAIARQAPGGPLAVRNRDLAPLPKVSDNALGIRGPLLLGLAVILVFFGGFGTWAAMAPLDSAAIAMGTVIVDTNRKTIQHLEGGIVSEIHVRDGSVVKAGDPLVTLDETQPGSNLGVVTAKLNAALALEARLIAERDGRKEIVFPERLTKSAAEDPEAAQLIASQKGIFASRKESVESQVAILNQRIAQYHEEIKGLKGEIAAETRQLELIAQEMRDVEFLLRKGLERRQRYLNLQRQQADIQGSRARNTAAIARANQAIGEAELRIVDLTTTMHREVVEQLREVQTEIQDLSNRWRAAADVMRRTVITAPVSGTVVNSQVFTIGGVIAPGAPIMDIVPQNDDLIIDAKVDPQDIEVVHPGLKAQVRLTAYSTRLAPILEGHVEHVSADRLVDERTGMAYYTARITFDDEQEKHVEGLELYPGMPAEVMIVAGERTPLSYLMRPVFDSFRRAMKED